MIKKKKKKHDEIVLLRAVSHDEFVSINNVFQ